MHSVLDLILFPDLAFMSNERVSENSIAKQLCFAPELFLWSVDCTYGDTELLNLYDSKDVILLSEEEIIIYFIDVQ